MKVEVRSGLTYSGTCSFVAGLNIPFVSVSGTTISIDNHIELTFAYQKWYINVNGGGNSELARINDPQTVTVVYNDSVFYIQINDSSNRRGAFFYEKLSNLSIYGSIGNGSSWSTYHVFYNLEEIPLYDVSNTSISYSRDKRLNYTNPLGTIDYTASALFKAGYKDITDRNFVSCSTVTSNQVITFNNTNYYTIGTNTLVAIDQI